MTRTLVIVNPASRAGATRRRFPAIERKLRRALGAFELVWTEGPRDAERIAREAARSGYERLLIAGGDGTASEVATGLLTLGSARLPELGFLPLGTGGDLLRTLGVPRSLDRALAQLALGAVRTIDAGRLRYTDASGKERTSYFTNETSVGLSGLAALLVTQGSKRFGARAAFLQGTLRGLARFRAQPARVLVDGGVFYEGPLVLATASNGRYFGGGMQVAPSAVPDDGAFDVVVIGDLSRAQLYPRLPLIYRGTHLRVRGVSQTRGRVVEVTPLAGAARLEADGEPLGCVPARAELVPGALRVVGVPV